MSVANPLWGHHGFTENCSSSALMLGRPRRKVYDEEKVATVARLEDLSSQSFGRNCIDRYGRDPDNLISAVIWGCWSCGIRDGNCYGWV